MEEQTLSPKLKKMLEDLYGMKIEDEEPITEEEQEAFERHLQEMISSPKWEDAVREECQNGQMDT